MTSTEPEPKPKPEPEPARAPEPYAPADGGQPYPAAPKTNTLAIISLVSAFFVSLAAVITGHLALEQIRRTGEGGRGLAIAGLVLGYVSIAATALMVVVAIVFSAMVVPFIIAAVNGTAVGMPPLPATSEPRDDESNGDGPEGALPTGTLGAANFDDGNLSVGTGPDLVDVYFDPMCPYCRQFEETNGGQLATLVADGSITLRLYPLTFLDRASQGTAYSTRASAALTCQATLNPENLLAYQAALFAHQPAENTAGLSDTELAALADGTDISDCLAAGEYQAWSQANTARALNGPIPNAEISRIQGTPTVIVNGGVYNGALTDPAEFRDFLRANSVVG